MLYLLSPAKSLDYETALPKLPHTEPAFLKQSAQLIGLLKKKTQQEIADLMSISDQLAQLNLLRYATWSKKADSNNARQAIWAFNGDVYEGLDAHTLSAKNLEWAQQHLIILSGLYGVLRPLDLMQPYRLEMGTALQTERGNNLYQFWGSQIAQYLNQQLEQQSSNTIVNLASQEYFKSVHVQSLKATVIECVFEDKKDDKYKIISFLAKRARGLMARYAIEHKIKTPAGLLKFDSEGYRYAPQASSEHRFVFRRDQR